MFTVVLIAAAALGVWCGVAVLVALLAGGVIRARDRRDVPYGGAALPRPVARIH